MHCCPSYKTHIIHEGILDVPVDEFGSHPKNQLWSAEQTVRRFLKRNGYCRGKKKLQYFLSEANMQKRDIFLRTLIKNRAKSNKERLREVYLDESYIHHHYKWKEGEDLYDPCDKLDLDITKDKHKGERYCFICAIQTPATCPRNLKDDKGGVVPGSWWAFCPTRKQDHRGDYHKVFKGDNFTDWFKHQLLDNLNEPLLIIMDNAKYHCVYETHAPKVKVKKAQFQEYLRSVGVPFDEKDTNTIVKAKTKAYILENKQWETVKCAEEGATQSYGSLQATATCSQSNLCGLVSRDLLDASTTIRRSTKTCTNNSCARWTG